MGGEITEKENSMQTDTSTLPVRYWIAVNGCSCAASQLPWRNPTTNPVAEQMWGFLTVEEALRAQKLVLTKPTPEVMAYLQGLGPDIKSGRVVYKRPENPEPPTRGRTAWMEEAEADRVDPACQG
jgi:hypothetical protein